MKSVFNGIQQDVFLRIYSTHLLTHGQGFYHCSSQPLLPFLHRDASLAISEPAWGDVPSPFHFPQQQPLILAVTFACFCNSCRQTQECPKDAGQWPRGEDKVCLCCSARRRIWGPCSSLQSHSGCTSTPSARMLVENSHSGAGLQWQHQARGTGCLSRGPAASRSGEERTASASASPL